MKRTRPRFPKLAAAMAEYDRTAPARANLWAEARSDADVSQAHEADAEAWRAVRLAFNADEENNLPPDVKTARGWAKLTLR